jgi:hypothetical protein
MNLDKPSNGAEGDAIERAKRFVRARYGQEAYTTQEVIALLEAYGKRFDDGDGSFFISTDIPPTDPPK